MQCMGMLPVSISSLNDSIHQILKLYDFIANATICTTMRFLMRLKNLMMIDLTTRLRFWDGNMQLVDEWIVMTIQRNQLERL